jgi:acetyl esterase
MRTMMIGLLMLVPHGLGLGAEPSPARSAAKRTGEAELQQAQVESYRQIGEVDLKMYIFQPSPPAPTARRAAIVFFFGGGWNSGSPAQFAPHAAHLAKRGMVAMVADYRVASRHGVKAVACVEDAKAAVAWIRSHADRLGIDPLRVAAAGGSAGGHLAAATATLAGYQEASIPPALTIPNALVLFNPALVLAPVPSEPTISRDRMADLAARLGDEPIRLSPYHHVRSGQPPTIIFHGRADATVPYRTAELFTEAMVRAGNRCELVGFEGKDHGFFNFQRDGNAGYQATLVAMDRFLGDLGYFPEPVSK